MRKTRVIVEYNQIEVHFLSKITVDEIDKKIYYIRVGYY